MHWNILRDMLICVPATFFFAILFRVPKKAVWFSSVLGAVGYAVYEWTALLLGSPIAGYFTGSLVMAACSEALARVVKMPVTVFIVPAIIPLVPGFGLYQTMMYLVRGQDAQAGTTGTSTLLAIAAMAIAMALTSVFTNAIVKVLRARKAEK